MTEATQRKHIETIYTHPDDLIIKDGEVYPENSVTGEIYECTGCTRDGGNRWFECYGCGFRFDAAHSDDNQNESERYTCPNCEHPRKRDELVYLAAPYSHSWKSTMIMRARAINRVTAQMIRNGILVFSPITYVANSPSMERFLNMSQSHYSDVEAWTEFYEWDLQWLRRCDRLVVLMLEGWKESKGVGLEIAEAERLGMPIEYREA